MSNKKSFPKKSKKYITASAKETQQVAARMAQDFLRGGISSGAIVLALQGDLGAGKTTFVQGFAKGLGIKEKILSPTFVLMRKYGLKGKVFKYFYHLDCYRLENENDLEALGFTQVISDPCNIVAIEWPERVKKILPDHTKYIRFAHREHDTRILTVPDGI